MSLSRGLFGVIVLCLAPVLFLSACGGGGGGGAVITTGGGGTGSGGSGGTSTGPISTPPRAFPGDYDIRLDPHIAAAEYSSATSALPVALLCDDAHGQVFVSDKAHNQISVLATTDAHLIAAIPLPAPVGMSLSVDHSTLYVGSENVQSLYVINAATLQVIRRVSLPTSLTLAGADTWPYALADGSVMMVAGTWQLSPGSWPNVMQLWHPDTGVFEPPLPDPNPNLDGFGMPLPVRSADGEYLLISAGGLYLYSTANHSIVASALNAAGNFPLAMAISADGASIAQVTITDQAMADEADTLTFYDRSLRKIGQTQALKGSFQTLLYNGDGTVVYDSQAGQGAETVGIDSSTLAVTGYLAIGMNDMNPELPQGIDANGNLWGWHGGSVYKVADGLHRTYAPVPVGGTGLLISGPTTGPTSGSTEVAFQLPAGALDAGNPLSSMQAYFGASPALKDEVGNFFGSTNPMLLATTPPGSGGVAPVLLMDSEGNPNFLDDAFVYGPEILPRVPIALPPGGGAISLRGYGLVQDKGQGPVPNVVVKIGGQLADLTTAITNPYAIGQYPEQTITF
ncbi:MAG TPA: hypothetical protein VFP94_05170, partial [Terriglobales bacterium]|nr:hypothetical protein [Terriglobales bacterium]